MATDKNELFHKRIERIRRINGGYDQNLEPRRMRRVLRILELNHRFLNQRDFEMGRTPALIPVGKNYRRAISRAA